MDQQDTVEEPSKGGSYIRQPDGSLVLQHRTAPAEMRDKRAPQQPAAEAAPQASTGEHVSLGGGNEQE